jgi:tetratricopeptide (TPR) repeat protein
MPFRSLRVLSILFLALFAGSFVLAPLDAQRRPRPPKEQPEEGDPEVAQSAIVEGEQALSRGNYKSAKTAFKKAIKEAPADQQAARGLAEAYFQSGDPELAVSTLNKCIESATAAEKEISRLTWVALGRLQFNGGLYDETTTTAGKLIAADAQDIDGHLLKGKVLNEVGQYDDAGKSFDAVRAAVAAKKKTELAPKKGSEAAPELADLWCSAGEAYFWLNRLHEANDCWANALKADENHMRTSVWMARLYLEQNHDSSTMVNYVEPMLKVNPNYSDLHLWKALALFFRWRSGEGRKALETCLKLNPKNVEALCFRAVYLVGKDQYEQGQKDYEAALAINPKSLKALGAKGLHGATLALKDIYDAAERAALAVNSQPAEFFEIVADGLSERFRYVEALPMYERGLKANPKRWTLYRGQGMAAMNKGDDVLGKRSLEIALKEDPLRNNLQTVNLLTLLDSYKNYQRIESPDGRWRVLVHNKDAKVMSIYYFKLLEEAWEAQTKKYGFEPRTPITVEAFPEHADFEVRSIGVTGLPALGVCFGQLITLDGPTARPVGSYNWASTLRHEMDHVFQIQLSNGQVPRWLAEGLSSYEEKRARPEWERHLEDQLFRYYHLRDIPSVRNFNEWFQDGSKVMFAYYLANVMCEFLDKHMGGFAVISKMLRDFGSKKTPDQVFAENLNMKIEEFDARFLEYCKSRIAHLKMVPFVPEQDVEDLLIKAEDGKATRPELVRLALGYMQKGARFDCETWLGIAARKGAEDAKGEEGAHFCYIKAMLARGDEALAPAERQKLMRAYLEKALARGLEDYQVFMMMAQMAQQAQDSETALHYINEARDAWREAPQPKMALFQYHVGRQNKEEAKKIAEEWMAVDEANYEVRMWLIENVYRESRDWEKMQEMCQQAIYTAPMERKVHEFRAFALRKLKRWDDAVFEYTIVRKLATGTPEEALAIDVGAVLDIAVTWLNAGDKEKAKKALEEAKQLDPKNPRIKTIEDQINGTDDEEEGY